MVGRPDVQQRSTAAASIEPVQNGPTVASAKRKRLPKTGGLVLRNEGVRGSNPLSSTPRCGAWQSPWRRYGASSHTGSVLQTARGRSDSVDDLATLVR
jgi:hypothetical protein